MRRYIIVGLFLFALFAGTGACMMASARLAQILFLDRLVLNLHYGEEIVEARNLKIVDKKPLIVSNGDVLPSGLQFLYGLLSLLSVCFGLVCYFAALWAVDKALLSGRITRFLIDLFSSVDDTEGPPDGSFTGCGVSIAERLQLTLKTKPHECSFLLVWYNREDKFRALLETCEFLNGHGHAIVVMFHFMSELRVFLDFCDNHQNNWMMINTNEFEDSSDCKAFIGTAGMVLASQRGERLLSYEREMVCILADCHPLPAKDKHFLDSLLSKESVDTVFQFVSVDESPIRSIRSSWFLKEKLFLSKGKRCFVESCFWQGLLNYERRQYIMTAASDIAVNSADEWIDVNCVRTGAAGT